MSQALRYAVHRAICGYVAPSRHGESTKERGVHGIRQPSRCYDAVAHRHARQTR
jgi:hypothetical protein